MEAHTASACGRREQRWGSGLGRRPCAPARVRSSGQGSSGQHGGPGVHMDRQHALPAARAEAWSVCRGSAAGLSTQHHDATSMTQEAA